MAAAVREVCSVVSPSAPPLLSLGATEEGLSCATELAALRQSVPAPGPSKTAREAGRSASSSGRHERGGGSEFASFSPRAVLQLHGLQRVEAALSVLRRAAKTDVVASCLEQRLPAWHQRCLLVRALFWLEQTCSNVADNQSAVDFSAGLLSVDQMYSAHVLARKEHGSAAMCYILSLLERDWESESGAAELLYAHLTPSGRQITNLLHRCHVAIREARARGVLESPACVDLNAQNVNGGTVSVDQIAAIASIARAIFPRPSKRASGIYSTRSHGSLSRDVKTAQLSLLASMVGERKRQRSCMWVTMCRGLRSNSASGCAWSLGGGTFVGPPPPRAFCVDGMRLSLSGSRTSATLATLASLFATLQHPGHAEELLRPGRRGVRDIMPFYNVWTPLGPDRHPSRP
jgi:hypothetical protein